MADYNQGFGIEINTQLAKESEVAKQLQSLINNLQNNNKNKISLDIDIKNGEVAQALKQLNNLVTTTGSNLKNSFNGMNLGDLQKALNITKELVNENYKIANSTKSYTGQVGNGGILKEQVDTYKNSQDGTTLKLIQDINSETGELQVSRSKLTIDTEKLAKEEDRLANAIANGREQVEKRNKKDAENLELTKTKLNSLVNSIKDNDLASSSQIDKFIKSINNLKTDSSKSEIESLRQSIKSYTSDLEEANRVQGELNKIQKSQPKIADTISQLQKNGILSQSDISGITNKASNITNSSELASVNKELSSLQNKEKNILSLNKQLDNLETNLDKLKIKYKNLVPDKESTDARAKIESIRSSVQKLDSTNFNNIQKEINETINDFKKLENQTKSRGMQISNKDSTSLLGYLGSSALKFSTWLGIGNLVMGIQQQLKDSITYTIDMNKYMTNFRIVTGQSVEQVNKMASGFKEVAKELHTTNTEIMSGSESLLRAGYDEETTRQMLEAQTIASNLSGQTNEQTNQQLIAIKNAYNLTGDEIMHVVDALSQLDNVSATSLSELATGLQYSANSAQAVGLSFDKMSAIIATVSSNTRKSAETIGNNFRSIFARFQGMSTGATTDENGEAIEINKVEKALNKVGIALRSDEKTFRDFSSVLDDLNGKWETLSEVDQSSITSALAGTYNRESLMSLMNNYDEYIDLTKQASDSNGVAMQNQEIYAQSLEAKINDLKNAMQGFYETIVSSDALSWFITNLTDLVNWLSSLDGKTVAVSASFVASMVLMTKAYQAFTAVQKGEFIEGLLGKLVRLKFSSVAGAGGLSVLTGGFSALGLAIKSTITSMIAFMATPLGATLTAIGLVLGVVTYNIYKHKQAQEELNTKIEANVESTNNLKQSIQQLNAEGIATNVQPLQEQQDNLQELINKRQEAIDKLKEMGVNDYTTIQPQTTSSGYVISTDKNAVAQSQLKATIQSLDKEIETQTHLLDESGIAYNKLTGEINQVTEAKETQRNLDIVSKIKEETKAQMDNVSYQQQARAEYDNYMNTLQSAYDEYNQLANVENASAEQKARLGEVIDTLRGKVDNLIVITDRDGKTRIENTGLIDKQIQMFQQEGVSVQTLTGIRLADQKQNASVQVGNTQMTYSQISQRIKYYQAEAQAVLQNTATIINALNLQQQAKNRVAMSGDDTRLQRAEQLGLTNAQKYLNQAESLQDILNQLDKIYSSGVNLSAPSGGSYGGGSYIPNTGGSDNSSSKKDVENLTLEIDRYKNLKARIDDVNSALDRNKILQETSNAQQRIKLIEEEIKLLAQKKTALVNLQNEQKNEQNQLANTLRNNGFNITDDNMVSNYQNRLKELENWSNNASGEEKERRQNVVKDLKETVDKYTELVHNSMASTLKDIVSIEKEIQDVRKAQLDNVVEVERQYNEIYKKMVDERISSIEKERDARIKSIQDARSAYEKSNAEEDFNKDLNKQQQALLQIQSQITNARLDLTDKGKAQLQLLLNQEKAQQEAIEELVKNRQRELNSQMFDEQEESVSNLADEQIKQLQETFSETNIAKIVAEAMKSGIIADLSGRLTSLKDFYLTWSQQFGNSLGITGDLIETEFVGKLNEAVSSVKDLSTALKDLNAIDFGNVNTGSFKTLTDLLGSVDVSSILPSIKSSVVLPEVTTSAIKASSKDGVGINISFDNLINVTGDIGELGEDSISKMTKIAKDAVSELSTKLKNQFSQLGLTQ